MKELKRDKDSAVEVTPGESTARAPADLGNKKKVNAPSGMTRNGFALILKRYTVGEAFSSRELYEHVHHKHLPIRGNTGTTHTGNGPVGTRTLTNMKRLGWLEQRRILDDGTEVWTTGYADPGHPGFGSKAKNWRIAKIWIRDPKDLPIMN